MHWIALPLPWCDEASAPPAGAVHDAAAAAWWALRFTPRVALVDAEAILLEVSTTERLWGGREALLTQVLQAWAEGFARRDGSAVAQDAGGPATSGPEGTSMAVRTVGAADTARTASRGSGGSGAAPPKGIQGPQGTEVPWGIGPTALVAQARLRMALAGHPSAGHALADQGPLGLPLHTLTALRPHVASLERMGCRTWGALRALPRAGVSRRFGAAVLRVLDQALGDVPEAHVWLELPAQFVLTSELPALAESADALLWGASRCLAALQGWLQARQQGVLGLELAWRHDLRRMEGVAIPPTQALQVRTAQPTQDIGHLRRLLSENLARTTLAAPANQITLRLLEAAPLPHRSASLLPPDDLGGGDLAGEQGEALHQLLERLSARLGADRVQTPLLQADHRPECMQQWRPAAELLRFTAATPHAAVRKPPAGLGGLSSLADLTAGPRDAAPDGLLLPTWLLNPPRRLAVQGNRPCHHGLLRLLAGPHRFEAGWWSALPPGGGPAPSDGALVLRDYFVAYNDVAGLVWVFRERLAPAQVAADGAAAAAARPHRWFLHGVFA